MLCEICHRPTAPTHANPDDMLCICHFGNDPIRAAAWYATQRNNWLQHHREHGQLALPLESPMDLFNKSWATYRDGQRTMCHAIVTFLEQMGHTGIAKRVAEKFGPESG